MDLKLSKRVKERLKIDQEDDNECDKLMSTFYEHFQPQITSQFSRGGKSSPLCLYSDLFCDESSVLCGFDGGSCAVLNLATLTSENVILDKKTDWRQSGLSSVRCSRTSPALFFTSSTDGVINGWDRRDESRKPCHKFSPETPDSPTKAGGSKPTKPILEFDISCNDQLVCGGTEKVGEDSYLLFWDVRSSNLLGAYWESHSDDVTAVKFHPTQVHSIVSGSTDGLLNVFNLMEPAEDDSLQFSFNTNSSVDSVQWSCSKGNDQVICVTHTHEFQVWDAVEGDPVKLFDKKAIAKAMMKENPDTVYITDSYNLPNVSRVGLLTCLLSGGNARLIDLDENNELVPRGLFFDQTAIVQSAQILNNGQKWITFDENRKIKMWNLQTKPVEDKQIKAKEVIQLRSTIYTASFTGFLTRICVGTFTK